MKLHISVSTPLRSELASRTRTRLRRRGFTAEDIKECYRNVVLEVFKAAYPDDAITVSLRVARVKTDPSMVSFGRAGKHPSCRFQLTPQTRRIFQLVDIAFPAAVEGLFAWAEKGG